MADRYWVGGTANWDATAGTKWALTSGGAGGQAVPTSADNVFFDAASGAVTVTITAAANCDNLNFTGFTGTIAGTSALNVYGSLTLSAGMTRSYSGTLSMLATATGKTITMNGKDLANITFAGAGGGWILQDAFTTTGITASNGIFHTNGTLDTNGVAVNIYRYSNTGSATRAITLGASNFTCQSSFTIASASGMTVNAGTSTINLSPPANINVDFDGAGFTYYNLTITNTTFGNSANISGVNTFNNLVFLPIGTAGIRYFQFSANQTVNGSLTVTGGSATQRTFFRSNTLGTARTLTVAVLSAEDCDFRDITISGAAAGSSPVRAGDCGGNSGITFPAAKTVYWNLTGTQNWSATGWATTSGGSPGANNFPLAQDTAVFDNTGSANTVAINADWNIGTVNMSARTNAMTLNISSQFSVYKDWLFGTGVNFTGGSIMSFLGRSTQTVTSNGVQFTGNLTLNMLTGTFQLADNFVSQSTVGVTLTSGTFDAGVYNVTVGNFFLSGAATRTVNMGSGTWTLSGTGTVWSATTTTNLTFNKGTANIILSNTTTTGRTFNGGGLTYNKLTIGGTTGTSTLTLTGSNTFSEIASTKTVAHTITFTSGTTTTVTTWSVNGTSGNLVSIRASTAGSRATLAKAGGGTVTVDYADIKDSTASPVSTWYATNSVDSGNNLNWNILAAAAAFLMFFS